jgi:MFS family permease
MSAAVATSSQPRGWVIREGRTFRLRPLSGNVARLWLTSLTILFVELMLIRWVPAEIRYIGFFSNFLLMASFLGIGLGILLGRRGARWSLVAFPLLLLGVVVVVTSNQLDLEVQGGSSEIWFGLTDAARDAADTDYTILVLAIVMVTGVLAALAMPLGPLLRSMPPLKAYAVDIIGSLSGIALFGVMSALSTGPVVWFSVVAVLVILLVLGTRIDWSAAITIVVILAAIWPVSQSRPDDIWSPYYRISIINRGVAGALEAINVNGIPHQGLHCVECRKEPFYDQVYQWFPGRTYDTALVVGAGSGSDVALLLANNPDIQRIDAVEIDPRIQEIGIQDHPDRPYDDPRVHRHINDGRAFLRSTDQDYDIIIFALPDSLTLVSQAANVRLESFLFTEEAFESVAEHLTDDGIFVLYNYYREPWLVAKIEAMLRDAFEGTTPLLRTYDNVMATIAAGPLVASLDGAQPPGDRSEAMPDVGEPTPRPATDDWPFLYLRTGFVAPYYLVALGILLLGALIAVAVAAGVTGTSFRRFSPHFFVLGIAFLLLSTRSLVSFSLLFGTTWLVNALAFFGVLLSVLAAIVINWRVPIRRPSVLYAMLFVSIAVAWLLPPEDLLIDPPWLRYGLAVVLAFAPVFFANLVFTHSFRDTRTADMAFASNLLGSMVGGALEYLALITGYQALLLLVAGLYGLAWLFANRLRMLADRDLGAEEGPPERGTGMAEAAAT